MSDHWWQETLEAVRRRDYPAAKRAAVRGLGQQEGPRPWMALAAVLRMMGDLRGAREAMEQGFVRHAFNRIPAESADALRALILVPVHLESLTLTPEGAFGGGASVDWGFFLDGIVHQEFVPVELLERHPERLEALRQRSDVVVNLISDPDAAWDSLRVASRVVADLGLPAVNHPDRVLECGRARNFQRLSGIPGLEFPHTFDVDLPPSRTAALDVVRTAAAKVGYPFLLRRAGWHGGSFLERIDGPEAIASVNLVPGGGRHHVIQFRDYAGGDGLYRKIRMYSVEGTWYPRSVNVGKAWDVHFASYWELLQTGEASRLQAEEGGFLDDWRAKIGPVGLEALDEVARVVDLDWFGIDFTVLPDGTLFVFEVNPAMRLAGSAQAPIPGREVLSKRFKEPIINATRELVRNRAAGRLPV